MVSANREDLEALGPSWRTSNASDAATCSGSYSLVGRTGPVLETVTEVPDVRTSGSWAESNWLTGTCRLEVTGGTDMVEGIYCKINYTKAYNVC